MSDEYIPTTRTVRIAYVYVDEATMTSDVTAKREAAFDRWLQGVINVAFEAGRDSVLREES